MKRKFFSLALIDGRVEQCLSSCWSECVGSKARESAKALSLRC